VKTLVPWHPKAQYLYVDHNLLEFPSRNQQDQDYDNHLTIGCDDLDKFYDVILDQTVLDLNAERSLAL
jgi:hypothetical protein